MREFAAFIIVLNVVYIVVLILIGTVWMSKWIYRAPISIEFYGKIKLLFSSLNPFKKKEIIPEYSDEFKELINPNNPVIIIDEASSLRYDVGTSITIDNKIQEQVNAISVDLYKLEESQRELLSHILDLVNRMNILESEKTPTKKPIKKKVTKKDKK